MEMVWTEDMNVESYGDWDLKVDSILRGWIRKATGGEMVWTGFRMQNDPATCIVLGIIPLEEAKAVVEAMVRLEGQ